jgi:diaminohydroxyphosphoribosylaminopyrimidine deaminase/5-amino-6-(5-phosphoribosylamino)uracil reductase
VVFEGGPTLAWSAVRDGVVDRFVLYLAPKLIGGAAAPGILGGEGVATIEGALSARIVSMERVGEDLKVVSDVHRDR